MSRPFPTANRAYKSLRPKLLPLSSLLISTVGLHASNEGDAHKFFEEKVQPILSIRCYECHSHGKEMKGGLTLDSKSGWETGGDSGPAIIPGNVQHSLLLTSLSHEDDTLQMPPKDKLSEGEIAILTQWVRMGAPDPRVAVRKSSAELEEGRKHWAYQPITSPTPSKNQAKHPVDAWIQHRLDQEGLSANPRASRLELIRRATYDLTGLPPSPEAIDAYLQDSQDEDSAFAKVIDRLLASPAYGEKWGRHWLDIMRYADSTGCSSDWPIDDAWRYRDWVVNAFNQDKPFDAFLTEQLAGDLLASDMLKQSPPLDEKAYQDAIIATGFLALSKRYSVAPGTVPHLTIGDTLDQTWQALQGLSLSCARCHDHKFEPIPAADYYALYGIFDSSVYPYAGAENNQMAPLLVGLDSPQQSAKRMDHWTRRLPGPHLESKPRTLLLSNASRWGFEYHEESNAVVDRKPIAPWISSGGLAVVQNDNSPFTHLLPRGIKLVHFQGSFDSSELKRRVRWLEPQDKERSMALDFQLADLWDGQQQRFTVNWKGVDEPSSSVTLFSIDGNNLLRLIDGSQVQLVKEAWYHLQILSQNHHAQLHLYQRDGSLVLSKTFPRDLLASWQSEGDFHLELKTQKLTGSRAACVIVDNIVATCGPLPTFFAPAQEFIPASSVKDPAKLKELRQEAQQKYDSELPHKPATAFAMWEGTPNDSPIQKRGELREPGKVVERKNLELLGGQKLKHPHLESGRRELAGWLLEDRNPLTRRVFMNRVWQWHFGHGIVRTPNDFGHTGAKPTHPELLDHLAQEFRDQGYSLKAMHRYLMLTETYQRSSKVSAKSQAQDPENLWLSHYSPRRLMAEEVRDSILAVSGLLDDAPLSQPHPFPPYHQRSYSQHKPFSLKFEEDYATYSHHRRSLYLPSIRLLPDPFLSLFDAADSNLSVAQRGETQSPLQGLALMNSELLLEASHALAEPLLKLPTSSQQLESLYRRIFGVAPESDLTQRLLHHHARILEQSSPEEALSLIAQGLLSSNAFLYPF